MRSIHTLLEFLMGLININIWPEGEDELNQIDDDNENKNKQNEEEKKEEKESPIDFVYEHLFLKDISPKDKVLFYNWCKIMLKNENCLKKIYKLFTEKIFTSQKNIEELINR